MFAFLSASFVDILCGYIPLCLDEPRREKTCLWGFRHGQATNQAVQPQMIVRGLKFQV